MKVVIFKYVPKIGRTDWGVRRTQYSRCDVYLCKYIYIYAVWLGVVYRGLWVFICGTSISWVLEPVLSKFLKGLQANSKKDSQKTTQIRYPLRLRPQLSIQKKTFSHNLILSTTPILKLPKKIRAIICSPASCQLLIGSSKFGSQGRLFLWSCHGYLLCGIDHPEPRKKNTQGSLITWWSQ